LVIKIPRMKTGNIAMIVLRFIFLAPYLIELARSSFIR
jgi:hypothetical protein